MHLDRSVVSRWAHHDGVFQDALEKARTEPKQGLTADQAVDRLLPGEKERLVSMLGVSGEERRSEELLMLDAVRRKAETLNSPGEQRDMLHELYGLLTDLGVRWKRFKSDDPIDVALAILGDWSETVSIAQSFQMVEKETFDPELEEEKRTIEEEKKVLHAM